MIVLDSFAVLVCVLGALFYGLGKDKAAELGRLAFACGLLACGLLALCFAFATHVIRL